MLRSSLKTTLFGLMVLLLSAAPAVSQIVGTPQADEHFGEAVATGDFNNDGYADLAVGVHGDDNFGADRAGAVNVIYGTADGLDVPDNQHWAQGVDGVAGAAEDFDWFGYSVAVGDFNGDNFDDLAIGVPREDVNANTIANAGAVNVLYGSTSGLQTAFNQIWVQDDLMGGSGDEPGDQFGWSLAAGDFDGDGHDDLAIGIAHENVGAIVDAGAIYVVYGTNTGLDAAGSTWWNQSLSGTGISDASDVFGYSLAVGNFDNDNYDDLAIGIPGEDAGGMTNAGGVAVMYGTNTGLSMAGNQLWSQAGAIAGATEIGDQFGFSVTTGDFDDDGFDDLVAGVPFEDVSGESNAGAVNVIYGTAAGLSSTDNELFSQASADITLLNEAGDNFGYSLAAGDFDNDNDDDLAIGISHEDVGGGAPDAGAILVIAGSPGGLDPSEAAFSFSQDDTEVEGDAEAGDLFGHALAVGDFDDDGVVDIAVGVRYELVDGEARAGAVNVLYDVFAGVSSSDLWFQGATPVAIEPEAPGLPTTFALLPAYPNPFNPSTTLRYDVPEAGPVRITVFDALGREIALLVDEQHTAGHHEILFDAHGLPSGLYLVRMEAGNTSQTQRVTLLR